MREVGKNGSAERNFVELCGRAAACRLCPGMDERRAVLGPANGAPGARFMFVAEAPGRLGADRTGIPLHGDRSGDSFEAYLAAAGLTRAEIFVTNAVLCNPRDEQGRNRTPGRAEIGNCSTLLAAQIAVVDPRVVVSLGAVALAALTMIEPHGLSLAADVGRAVPWQGRTLVPLYHPGPRARIYRNIGLQTEDYLKLARFKEETVSLLTNPSLLT